MPKTKKRTAPKAKSKAVQKRAKRIGGFRARNAPKRKR